MLDNVLRHTKSSKASLQEIFSMIGCLDLTIAQMFSKMTLALFGEHTTEYPRSKDYAWLMPRAAVRLSCR